MTPAPKPEYKTSEHIVTVVEQALAHSHAKWTAGHTVTSEDYTAYMGPLRRYEAGHAIAALEKTRASSGWVKFSGKNLPPLHTSVMCRFELVGPVYDVAVYVGRDAAGEHKWVCGDVNLPQARITHWSLVHEPEDVE